MPVPQWQRECVEGASSRRSIRRRHTTARYASGEAARLSSAREGIETPTGRHLRCRTSAPAAASTSRSSAGDERTVPNREVGCSSHPATATWVGRIFCGEWVPIPDQVRDRLSRKNALEGFAVWTAIGPENRNEYGNVGGSTPHPSAMHLRSVEHWQLAWLIPTRSSVRFGPLQPFGSCQVW